MMKKALKTAALLLAGLGARAQDIHFSQFYETTILRNPALTGVFTGDYKVGVLYRSQWNSISQPYRTGLVDAELRVPLSSSSADFFSFGLLGYYDKAGTADLKTLGVYPAVNFNKLVNESSQSFISVGFTGGYLQRSYDASKMTFNSQFQNGNFNSTNANGEQLNGGRLQNWDLGAGISFNSNGGQNGEFTYFVGVSGYHFTRPKRAFYDESMIRLDMKWNVNAGLSWHLSETYGVQLHANYARQGSYNETIVGGLLGWKRQAARDDEPPFSLYLGAFYRVGDAAIPTIKVEYKRLALTASYDLNVSRLRTASNLRGGMELSLFATGVFSDPRYEQSRTLCPHFW